MRYKSSLTESVFLVGLPHSGKSELIACVKHKISGTGISFEDMDCRIGLNTSFSSTSRTLVVIKHFEHAINDHEANKIKAAVLQKILHAGSRIIISSTIQPAAILEFYDAAIKRTDPEKDDVCRKNWTEYKHALRLWKNILSGFIVCVSAVE